ncbi:MAG: hypothetical protein P4M15_04480 [Alphaproteobacteria bacterium]|nr:hypothetical protein [Alphaproteobacteria bacterium]
MYAVCVEEPYVGLMGRHVVEGQGVAPGAPLLDIMTPDGVVRTITSQGWGVVAHVEGGRVFPANNDERDPEDDEDDDDEGESGAARGGSGGGMGVVFSKGDVICHIVARIDSGSARKAGLHPRPAPSVRLRQMLNINRM